MSSWGDSWLSAWGDSWGALTAPTLEPAGNAGSFYDQKQEEEELLLLAHAIIHAIEENQ